MSQILASVSSKDFVCVMYFLVLGIRGKKQRCIWPYRFEEQNGRNKVACIQERVNAAEEINEVINMFYAKLHSENKHPDAWRINRIFQNLHIDYTKG